MWLQTLFIGLLTFFADAQSTTYVAPTKGLNQASQAYQLGIWSFILLFVVLGAAIYSLASMDYSKDTLLFVDVETTKAE